MENNNLNTDFLVKDILIKSTVHEPAANFTNEVMLQITELKPSWMIDYKPIISKKVWFILGTFLTLSIAIVILAATYSSGSTEGHISIARDIDLFTNSFVLYLKSLFSGLKIPLLFPICFGIVMFALLIETFFRKIFKT